MSFDNSFFASNRQKLIAQAHHELIVLTGNGLLQRSGDTTFPFRQDSSFWYLTGIDTPGVVLVLDGTDEYLIVPGRERTREVFDGSIDIAKLSQLSGVTDVLAEEAGWNRLTAALKRSGGAATLGAPDAYVQHAGMFTNPARQSLHVKLQEQAGTELALHDLRPVLAEMRAVKQPAEVAAIRKALDVTAEAFWLVQQNIASYQHEYEAAADITAAFARRGYQHAYEPIVASGAGACTLHYIANNQPIKKGELLLIDAGAEVQGYAADITRTFPVTKPTSRQRAVIQAVQAVQDFAFGLLRPGLLMKEYEEQVQQRMGKELMELKLIARPDKESVRQYFPHATSHFLGLDVHDVGDYTKPFQPGMVLTVEPGIYIPGEGIGVRVEDNVLITDSGYELLSQNLPHALD